MLPVDVKEENSQTKNTAKKRGQFKYIFFILIVHKTMFFNVSKVTLKKKMVNAYTVRSLGVEHFNTDLIYAFFIKCVSYAWKVQ